MEYISSDTNVWIDFSVISRLDLPFLLPYKYIMYAESIENELLYPVGLKQALQDSGLTGVEITTEEYWLAERWGNVYQRLTSQDRIALAIAKVRGITLLTGDGRLRKAAMQEGVMVLGTIGVLDQLFYGKYITEGEYRYCLTELKRNNGGAVRLPGSELEKRLKKL